MTKPTRAQIRAAQGLMKLDERAGRATPERVKQIADGGEPGSEFDAAHQDANTSVTPPKGRFRTNGSPAPLNGNADIARKVGTSTSGNENRRSRLTPRLMRDAKTGQLRLAVGHTD